VNIFNTDPLIQDILPPIITDVTYANFESVTGEWFLDSNDELFSLHRRGEVSIPLMIDTAGTYYGEMEFSIYTQLEYSRDPFWVTIYLGEEKLGRYELKIHTDGGASVNLNLGYLPPGNLDLRVVSENVRAERVMQIRSMSIMRLESVAGSEFQNNQFKLGNAVTNHQAPIYTSPYCLEGRTTDFSALGIAGETVLPLYNRRWYSNITLSESGATPVTVDYFNGVYQETVSLEWTALNADTASSYAMRLGDKIKLTGFDENIVAQEQVTLSVDGTQIGSGSAAIGVIYQPNAAGIYTVSVENSSGGVYTLELTVAQAEFAEDEYWRLDRGTSTLDATFSSSSFIYGVIGTGENRYSLTNGENGFTITGAPYGDYQAVLQL